MNETHELPGDSERRSNRRDYRLFWGIAAVMVVVIVCIYLFADSAPPDPSRYEVDLKPVPEGENAMVVFARETEAMRQGGTINSITLFRDRGSTKETGLVGFSDEMESLAREHVQTHRELLERFWLFVREAPRPLAYPAIDRKMNHTATVIMELTQTSTWDPAWTVPWITADALLQGMDLARLAIHLDILAGKNGEALEASLELADFAKELSAVDGFASHWEVMEVLHFFAIDCAMVALPGAQLDAAACDRLRLHLRRVALNHVDLAHCHRLELWKWVAFWRRQKNGETHAELPEFRAKTSWLKPFLLKPNMTAVETITLLYPLAEALEHGWSQSYHSLGARAEELNRHRASGWRAAIHPNALGRRWIAISVAGMPSTIEPTLQSVARGRCLEVALELRTFELRTGALPETLSELTPGNITPPPLDPVNDQPLRWHRETGRIYSVGMDGVDDGGDFKFEIFGDVKDWGIVYPWHVAADDALNPSQ